MIIAIKGLFNIKVKLEPNHEKKRSDLPQQNIIKESGLLMSIKSDSESRQPTVRFIGAGIGALTCAVLLRRSGYRVVMYDKCSEENVGGIASTIKTDCFRFSRGPTLVAMYSFYKAGFERLGLDFYNTFKFVDIDPIAKFFFFDGRTLTITRNIEATAAEFEKIEPGGAQQFRRFYRDTLKHYSYLEPLLDPRTPLWKRALTNPRAWTRTGIFTSAYRYVSKYFTHPDLIAALSRYALFSGDDPMKTSFSAAFLPVIEMAEGPRHIIGGLGEIAKCIKHLADQEGVDFEWNTEIDEIIVEGATVQSLNTKDGRDIRTHGDIVITNANLPYTYSHLLRNTRFAKSFREKHFTNAFCMINLAVENDLAEMGFDAHFVPRDYYTFIKTVQQKRQFTEDAIFWAVNYAALDKTAAPPGMSAVTISFDGPHITDKNYRQIQDMPEMAYNVVLKRFAQHGFAIEERKIRHLSFFNIDQWRDTYNKPFAAPFGLYQHVDPIGSISPSNKTKLKNLYHVGIQRAIPMTILDGVSLADTIICKC